MWGFYWAAIIFEILGVIKKTPVKTINNQEGKTGTFQQRPAAGRRKKDGLHLKGI